MRRGVLFLLHILCGGFLFCQNAGEIKVKEGEGLELLFIQIAEEYERTGEENPAYLAEILEELTENPVRINSASVARLEAIPLFSPFMAVSVRDYIRDFGEILSLYELAAVPGFDLRIAILLSRILDFSPGSANSGKSFFKSISDGRSQFLTRGSAYLEMQKGYTTVTAGEWQKNSDCRYLYPPGRLYAQYKYTVPERFKFALTTERDGGEQIGDYIGASFQLDNAGVFKTIVAGDFTARFGQGLVFWNSGSLFTSPAGLSFAKTGTGLSAYTSTDENTSFRGAGVSLGKGRAVLSIFLSSRERDARISDGGYTSLLNTGLHNTTTTLARRRSLGITVAGGNLNLSGEHLRGGVSFSFYKYSHPYTGRDSLLLNRQARFGNSGANFGADILLMKGRTRYFSEVATDLAGSMAALGGFTFSSPSGFNLSGLIRIYSGEYISPYGGAVSYSGKMRGEHGANISAAYQTSSGNNYTLWCEWIYEKHTPRWGAEALFRWREFSSLSIKATSREGGISVRAHVNIRKSARLSLIARGEAVVATTEGDPPGAGWLLYAESLVRSKKGRADCSARIGYFNTPQWNLRIYTYERDVLYGYSVPVFYGRGVRWYLNIHAELFRGVDLWLKFSRLKYLDREKAGEGLDQMPGPSSTEIKAELRIRF